MASSSQSHQQPPKIPQTPQQALSLMAAAGPTAPPSHIPPPPQQPLSFIVEAQVPAGPVAPPPPSRRCDKCMERWMCLVRTENCFNNLWDYFSTCTECDML